VYTIGHSTRPIDVFIAMLREFEIEMVIDVRTVAASRHNPQYNEAELNESLRQEGFTYLRMKGLGGFRHTTSASINVGWNNLSFRGYADYMQTLDFRQNLQQLIGMAEAKRTAIMCAEAVPWRCHRSLIGDALIVRRVSVEDIIAPRSSRPHRLTSFARENGGTITYPATMV
jgi:uncharacterized protein (DUF488 family)